LGSSIFSYQHSKSKNARERLNCSTTQSPKSATSERLLGSIGQTTEGNPMMAKKITVMTLAVLAFAFGFAARSNAGTEVIDGYSNPVPTYNYNYAPPPPRPIYYAPQPPVNVVVVPAYGYCGPRFVAPRFVGRHVYLRRHHHWR
jgi:hypothetical protein